MTVHAPVDASRVLQDTQQDQGTGGTGGQETTRTGGQGMGDMGGQGKGGTGGRGTGGRERGSQEGKGDDCQVEGRVE